MNNHKITQQYSSNFEKKIYESAKKNNILPSKVYLFATTLFAILCLYINFIHKHSTTISPATNICENSANNSLTDHRYLLTTLTFKIQNYENLSNIFNQMDISSNQINTFFTDPAPQKGDIVNFEFSDGSIQSITYQKPETGYLAIYQKENQIFTLKKIVHEYSEKPTYKKIKISSSLYEDAISQHLPAKLLHQVINIFSWDIDFSNEIHRGDYIEIIYNTYYSSHKSQEVGPILAARLHAKKQFYTVVKFDNEYFKPDGSAIYKAFIRTPVKYTRISSKFTGNRKHPILHKLRAHKGVDYAAPTGTPVKACGDGTVKYIGRKGGYGNTLILKHGLKYTTLYAHLSKFAKSLKKGSKVKQGQTIAYVGQTGLATGPHLHFEFRVFGIHKDPLTVKFPPAKSIGRNKLGEFNKFYNSMLAIMDNPQHGYA